MTEPVWTFHQHREYLSSWTCSTLPGLHVILKPHATWVLHHPEEGPLSRIVFPVVKSPEESMEAFSTRFFACLARITEDENMSVILDAMFSLLRYAPQFWCMEVNPDRVMVSTNKDEEVRIDERTRWKACAVHHAAFGHEWFKFSEVEIHHRERWRASWGSEHEMVIRFVCFVEYARFLEYKQIHRAATFFPA